MKDSLTQITIVLDRSGSMAVVRDATISGFNEFVEGQRKAPGEANLTLIQFDTENPYEVVFDRAIGEVPKLTQETFVPRAGTPLHDALGRTITQLGQKLKNMAEADRPGKVVVVVMTDGQENSSHEYVAPQVAEMIRRQREIYKWEFLFLGANQDAILTGERLNIPAVNAVMYSHAPAGTANVMRAASANVGRYRASGQSVAMSWTPEQREEAMEKDEKNPRQAHSNQKK